MKKHILTTALCLAAMLPSFAQQTKRIMTVIQKDGTKVEYKVNNVQNVTFTNKVYANLNNQWALNDDVKDLTKVTMLEQEDAYVFSLFGAEAAENAVIELTMPKALVGNTVELGSAGAENVSVKLDSKDIALTGTVQVKFDKFKTKVNIIVDTETADYSDLRCKWNYGSFTQVYSATNTITATNVNIVENFNIVSALEMKPTTTGAPTAFVFGDAETTTAEGMKDGKAAVAVSIAASKLYKGDIDMATETDSYTFQYYDYSTRIVYEKVKAGTITTAQNAEGKLYIKVAATLDDNRVIEVEYYGATTEINTLDGMVPEPVAENGYKYYNADGDVSMNKTIGTCYLDEYKGNFTFYFVPEGDTKNSSDKVTLKVSQDLINAGSLSLADLGDTAIFNLKFKSIGLQSTAEGHGYGNTPNNGTMEIKKSEDGVYEFSIEVTNRYKSPWGSSIAGDNTKLVLKFKGTTEKY